MTEDIQINRLFNILARRYLLCSFVVVVVALIITANLLLEPKYRYVTRLEVGWKQSGQETELLGKPAQLARKLSDRTRRIIKESSLQGEPGRPGIARLLQRKIPAVYGEVEPDGRTINFSSNSLESEYALYENIHRRIVEDIVSEHEESIFQSENSEKIKLAELINQRDTIKKQQDELKKEQVTLKKKQVEISRLKLDREAKRDRSAAFHKQQIIALNAQLDRLSEIVSDLTKLKGRFQSSLETLYAKEDRVELLEMDLEIYSQHERILRSLRIVSHEQLDVRREIMDLRHQTREAKVKISEEQMELAKVDQKLAGVLTSLDQQLLMLSEIQTQIDTLESTQDIIQMTQLAGEIAQRAERINRFTVARIGGIAVLALIAGSLVVYTVEAVSVTRRRRRTQSDHIVE
jgi:hypothetical protein